MKSDDYIDGSLYPDEPVPESLPDMASRIDYLARLCSAWDFGIMPDLSAIEEIRKPEWRNAVDAGQLLTSRAYHLLRSFHGLPGVAYLGDRPAYIVNDPELQNM